MLKWICWFLGHPGKTWGWASNPNWLMGEWDFAAWKCKVCGESRYRDRFDKWKKLDPQRFRNQP
jgi:hypothetical protein